MEIITYSLRGDKTGSDHFYQVASAFTDEVLAQGNPLLREAIQQYPRQDGEAPEESLFELLTLGTLWHVYGDDALDLCGLPRQVLTGLSHLREQGGSLKPGVDFLRGILATLFLEPNDAHTVAAPSPAQLDQ
ncbi:MAG TPA: hypothetical protein VD902_02415, partial [Symbiobacteriaceae bacterium]|nr:hypothetical protein [Symbiobacteriaceae bacterium]